MRAYENARRLPSNLALRKKLWTHGFLFPYGAFAMLSDGASHAAICRRHYMQVLGAIARGTLATCPLMRPCGRR